ncbi:MAG: SDR family oxidoreductase [Pseudomonadota bacterium]
MQDKPANAVLIVGCGDIGRRVAKRLQAGDRLVTGVVRSAASAERLQHTGVRALRVDLDSATQPDDWTGGVHEVFYFAPPPPDGETDPRMRRFLRQLDSGSVPRRIVYISTSAVYGDCNGAWITEAQPVKPTTARGQRRLDAEQQLRRWAGAHKTSVVILRVPGIYGPGKLPLSRLQKGWPVLREADAPWTNRIHADDLAMICIAAMEAATPDVIYNVSDGRPSNMTDYFIRVADAAGLPRPPEVDRAEAEQVLSPGMLSFLKDSRRMRNDKLLRELGITLQYPDLAAGLKFCFKD